eukprot:Pgem_evm1s19628
MPFSITYNNLIAVYITIVFTLVNGQNNTVCVNVPLSQCGGDANYNGETCCPENHFCMRQNQYWSDCQKGSPPSQASLNSSLSSTPSSTASINKNDTCQRDSNANVLQCSGRNYVGETCCPSGSVCTRQNDDWYDCQPQSSENQFT